MQAQRSVVVLFGLALAAAGCTDDLAPITYHWNQAQVTMLQRIAVLKAAVVDMRRDTSADPRMAIHDWYGDQLRTSMRAFEQSVVEVELQFQANETAVADAMKTGKAAASKSAVEEAEADFDVTVARAEGMPREIREALAAWPGKAR